MERLELITAPNCHECEEVVAFLKEQNLTLQHTSLTMEQVEESALFIFPALMRDKSIVAYGTDIINYIKAL